MADNYDFTPGTGATARAVEKSSKKAGVGIIDIGGAGAENLLTAGADGATAATAAVPVTQATEDRARTGIITETAPATDTASSGLNGRLQRIAQRVTALIALLPTALGSAAAAASLAVTQSTEDIARVGIVTETAPASDTASSGLNGRLQRIAQRLTSLIALVPAALTTAGSFKVATIEGGGKSGSATFTPAAASHVAGDCNGAAADFTLGAPSGCVFMITDAELEIDGGTAEATAWRLYLYNVTPPSATADDGAWDLASGDRASYLGYIDLGTAIDLGSTQWVETHGVNKVVKLSGTTVFGYLVNLTTLTPANVAHIVKLYGAPL